MIINSTASALGPGFAGIVYCAALWVITMFLVLCHRAGIQIVGGMMVFIGLFSLIVNAPPAVPLLLIITGCAIHWFGRILHHLKNRN